MRCSGWTLFTSPTPMTNAREDHQGDEGGEIQPVTQKTQKQQNCTQSMQKKFYRLFSTESG